MRGRTESMGCLVCEGVRLLRPCWDQERALSWSAYRWPHLQCQLCALSGNDFYLKGMGKTTLNRRAVIQLSACTCGWFRTNIYFFALKID